MKPKRRILSLLLAICLVVGIMPTAAFAANNDKAIQLGASNISGYDSTNGYDYIYYGEWDNSPIKWRVLDEQTNTQNEGLFLLSDVLLGTGTDGGVYFDNSGSDSNVWQNSTAQTWCKNFYSNNFSSKEQNAVLRAPFDGVVANLFAKPYNTASTSEVFCSVIDTRTLEANFTVLESELPLIKVGDRVEVTPFALSNVVEEGRISEINPLVDAEGMVQVRAAVNDRGKLFEGMNVRVSIHRSLGKQLVVPKTAVVLRSGNQVVFKLDESKTKASWVYVHTGLENANEYTIADSEGDGLKEGDWIITTGNINLAHEAPVKVIDN